MQRALRGYAESTEGTPNRSGGTLRPMYSGLLRCSGTVILLCVLIDAKRAMRGQAFGASGPSCWTDVRCLRAITTARRSGLYRCLQRRRLHLWSCWLRVPCFPSRKHFTQQTCICRNRTPPERKGELRQASPLSYGPTLRSLSCSRTVQPLATSSIREGAGGATRAMFARGAATSSAGAEAGRPRVSAGFGGRPGPGGSASWRRRLQGDPEAGVIGV